MTSIRSCVQLSSLMHSRWLLFRIHKLFFGNKRIVAASYLFTASHPSFPSVVAPFTSYKYKYIKVFSLRAGSSVYGVG